MSKRKKAPSLAGPKKPKVMMALPSTGTFKASTTVALAELCRVAGAPITSIVQAQSCYIHVSREKMLARALAGDFTHLFFVDSDMAFPPDGLDKLLAADKDIIGAAYNMRSRRPDGARITTVKFLPEAQSEMTPLGDDPMLRVMPEWPTEPFEVRAVPTGFMLIRLDAIRDLPRPRFGFSGSMEDGTLVGEDVFFCDLAREHGLEVWCDPTIMVGHIGDAVY